MGEFFIPRREDICIATTTIQGNAMLTIIIFTAIFLPITLGPSTLAQLISSNELKEMGVCLDNTLA